MKSILFSIAALGCVALSAAPLVQPLPSPAHAASQGSNLTAGPDGTLYLTWSEPGFPPAAPPSPAIAERALRVATLAPGATNWSTPHTIVSTPHLMENWADFASLCIGTDGAWMAQWFQREPSADAHGYAGWFARSVDQGESWSKPAPLGHEFISLAPLSGGRTLVVWLESLSIPREQRTPGMATMRLLSRVLSPEGTSLGEWVVDPDVCNCCQTTLVPLANDRAWVAYRGHTRDEIRDHSFAHFDGSAWSSPRLLHTDDWKIAACPVNGPAAAANGETLTVAWFTAAQSNPRVHARVSLDGGHTWGSVLPIDLGRPMGRLDLVMLPDKSAVVVWIEIATAENAAGIYARRIFPDGTLSAPGLVTASSQARTSGFPRAAVRSDGRIVISWMRAVEPMQVQTCELDPAALPRQATAAIPTRTVGNDSVNARVPLEFCIAPIIVSKSNPHP